MAIWIGLLVCATVVGALASYVANQPDLNGQAGKNTTKAGTTGNSVTASHNTETSVVLFAPKYEGYDLKFETRNATVPSGQDPRVFAVNEYLKASNVAPADSQLLSITIEGSTATLDFNSAFNQTYGTDDERTLLNGILRTLGQFPQIEKALFTINGKPFETMGNIDLTEPQPVIH